MKNNITEYTEIPVTFKGTFITVNQREMVWQNNSVYTGYVYMG